MAFEQRDMTGALFPNDKQGNEARPDFTGNIVIDGKKLRLAGWKKRSQSGKSYLSLQASEERPQQGQQQPQGNGRGGGDAFEDEIPF